MVPLGEGILHEKIGDMQKDNNDGRKLIIETHVKTGDIFILAYGCVVHILHSIMLTVERSS